MNNILQVKTMTAMKMIKSYKEACAIFVWKTLILTMDHMALNTLYLIDHLDSWPTKIIHIPIILYHHPLLHQAEKDTLIYGIP
jgi:hypothetical protein